MNAPPVGHPTPDIALSPLEQAGLRLDAAIARFELAGMSAVISGDERQFGDAQEQYFEAQVNYREVLQSITGADPDGILRRLAR